MKRALLMTALAVGAFLAGTAPVRADGDPEAGRVKFETCLGCHGVPNYTNAYPAYRVPKLAGQSAAYVTAALKAYQSGERKHPTMIAQAASLGDQDIEDIATYVASLGAQ
jgi:cytochrome c553